jgi:hypothetical protein
MDPPLIMSFSVRRRIDLYRATLRSEMQTTDSRHLQQSGDQGREGGGAGQADAGEMSVGDDGGAAMKQFTSVKTTHDILVLEGVDEDAEGADATFKEELLMLAHDSPMWMEELEKYLRNEEKEQNQVQAERALRLARWREGIAMQPN